MHEMQNSYIWHNSSAEGVASCHSFQQQQLLPPANEFEGR